VQFKGPTQRGGDWRHLWELWLDNIEEKKAEKYQAGAGATAVKKSLNFWKRGNGRRQEITPKGQKKGKKKKYGRREKISPG